jgi:hypothetical protein
MISIRLAELRGALLEMVRVLKSQNAKDHVSQTTIRLGLRQPRLPHSQ